VRTAPPRREDGTFGVGEPHTPKLAKNKGNSGQFKKGEHRVGRVKGTPNKCSIAARDIMERRGYNPVDALLDIALDPRENPDRQLRAHQLLLERCYPKLQDHTVHDGDLSDWCAELKRGEERAKNADVVAPKSLDAGEPMG